MIRLRFFIIFVLLGLSLMAMPGRAENYVNWKAGFWLTVPDDWQKVDYKIVDHYLALTDTSRDIYNYEAVFAPKSSNPFISEAYLVITFEKAGPYNKHESDSVLLSIAKSYSSDVYDAPIVNYMSDLRPGRPYVDYDKRTINVLTDMAYTPESRRRLWMFMQFNDLGMISLYFYSPDSSYTANRKIFERIVNSLSFDNLREAAGRDSVTFTDVAGKVQSPTTQASNPVGSEEAKTSQPISSILTYIIIVVVAIIIFGVIWNFKISPKMRKKK